MGKNAKDGPFTPLVVIFRNQLGTKQFNQLRGKAISLHSQGRPPYSAKVLLSDSRVASRDKGQSLAVSI